MILLVAMIAAIALTLRQRKDSKYSSPSDQVKVKARDRMTVVKMPATLPALDSEALPATPSPEAKA
jgi:NADH-quinone oxidoreductase subunit J